MTKWQYRLAIAVLYGAFGLFVIGCIALVASFTVIPMMRNHADHGTIFNAKQRTCARNSPPWQTADCYSTKGTTR